MKIICALAAVQNISTLTMQAWRSEGGPGSCH